MAARTAKAGSRSRPDGEAVAIQALGFIAADPELMPRFLAVTGIDPGAIRQAAAEPGFFAGVLQFLLAHEPTLLRFSAECGVGAGDVAQALAALPLGDARHERAP